MQASSEHSLACHIMSGEPQGPKVLARVVILLHARMQQSDSAASFVPAPGRLVRFPLVDVELKKSRQPMVDQCFINAFSI